MKTVNVKLKLFSVKELSDEAREKAYQEYANSCFYPWNDDNENSLNAFANVFPVKIKNFEYGYRNDISWNFTESDEIQELSGQRLATYLWNNYRDTIYQRKYKTSFKRMQRLQYHPMLQQKASKLKNGEEDIWVTVRSNIFLETHGCPLTGYTTDYDLMLPIWEFMEKPDSRDFYDLMGDCLESWLKAVVSDYEYNGRNYMQLPTAGCSPVEPHRRFCGLHSLLSARKRQLTYSFCYRPFLFISLSTL